MKRVGLATMTILVVGMGILAGGCDVERDPAMVAPTASSEALATAPVLSEMTLPPPRSDGPISLEACLAQRRSVRAYTDQDLTWEQVGQLLWAAQGLTSDWGGRTAPSAGALYPLEVYVVTRQGLYRYVPQRHQVETLATDDRRQALQGASLNQGAVGAAPAVFVVTGVYARTAGKYGDRATRYVRLEAGHAAQNLVLQAVALDLGGVTVGAFDDAGVQRVLSLPSDHEPLYVIPVGVPG